MNVSPPKRPNKRRNVFSRRSKHVQPLDGATDLEDSSESSMDPSFLEKDMKNHIGELKVDFKRTNQQSRSSIKTKEFEPELNTSATSITGNGNRLNDERMKDLILKMKSKPKRFSDTPTPSKPYRCNSFKMDGVPAFVSREIQKKARRDAEKRQKRQQAKSKAENEKLHESMSSLSYPQVTRKQRPKVPFLDVPKEHPLYWDYSQLSASDFPEKDRIFLAHLFKNPQKTLRGRELSTRVDLVLRKMQLFDWDVAIIGRCASVLFHPERNPLGLSQAATEYFFSRFNSLKAHLVEGSPVSYEEDTYRGHDTEELFERLRRDCEEATRSYDSYQVTSYL